MRDSKNCVREENPIFKPILRPKLMIIYSNKELLHKTIQTVTISSTTITSIVNKLKIW